MKQKKKKAVLKDVPSLVAQTFEALGAAEDELRDRFAAVFAALHPSVPFAVEEVESETTVSIALTGALAAKVPAHWRFDPSSTAFNAGELETLGAMADVIRAHLLTIDVTAAWIEFDSEARLEAADTRHSGFEE